MKLWITEAIDPSLPHVDYISARDIGAAERAAERLGNVRIVGELYTKLPCLSPKAIMDFVESNLVASGVAWLPNAKEQLGAFISDGGEAAGADDE